jgi:hypothetical protein
MLTTRFHADLFKARPREARVLDSDEIDTPETMQARMDLGRLADELSEAIRELESRIRNEMKA